MKLGSTTTTRLNRTGPHSTSDRRVNGGRLKGPGTRSTCSGRVLFRTEVRATNLLFKRFSAASFGSRNSTITCIPTAPLKSLVLNSRGFALALSFCLCRRP